MHVDDLLETARTRRVSLYRLHPAPDLRSLLTDRVLDDEHAFAVVPVDVGGLPALLAAGLPEDDAPAWGPMVRALTRVDVDFRRRTASAALLIRSGGDVYAVTFGHGWRMVRAGRVDREFGVDFAVRVLDPAEIRQVTRWALSARSRVDRNTVPGGQELWAYGLREHAELVRQLTGYTHPEVPVELTHVRRTRGRRLRVECGDGIRLPLSGDGAGMAADLAEITRILRRPAADPRLAPLTWVRRIPPDDTRRPALERAVLDLLAGRAADGEVGIAHPARYHDGPAVDRYRGRVNGVEIDTADLGLADLTRAVLDPLGTGRLDALRAGRVAGYDEHGESPGGELPALHWIAAEGDHWGTRCVLLDGEWYELGDEYRRHVRAVTERAFAHDPGWTLPAWGDHATEADYNRSVAEADPRFLLLDRALVRTRAHRRGFEACDLLGPGNELVHVKRTSTRTGSAPLSHLFAQGLVAAETLADAAAWRDFTDLVAARSPERAASLGRRPAAVVYAVHRSDRPLTAATLFTFAASALVSAWVTLTAYGIPVHVCVIP
ncbi:TIGR04141 family sporadically distributed protein [Actinokineospora soli]